MTIHSDDAENDDHYWSAVLKIENQTLRLQIDVVS